MHTDRNNNGDAIPFSVSATTKPGKWEANALIPPSRSQLKEINAALHEFNAEHARRVELSGVIGVSESSAVLWQMFSREKRADVTAAQAVIGERFRWVLIKDNADQVLADMRAALVLLAEARPIDDKRKTPEQAAQEAEERNKRDAEREAKENTAQAAWLALYGAGRDVTAQPGQMFVTLLLCYDNSDSQSDYFDRHARLSPTFALALLPKGPETEAKARAALAKVADLAGVEFKWHAEKYSRGHGNYLESAGFELSAEVQAAITRKHYDGRGDGRTVTHGHWEIQFFPRATLPAHKAFDAVPVAQPSAEVGTVGEATISRNAEKDGIEVRFPAKPDQTVIDALKAAGWRWSRFAACWWKKDNGEIEAEARAILGQVAAA